MSNYTKSGLNKEKYKGLYRISTARLKDWDYSQNGYYFVTICTKNRKCYFGNIVNDVETQDLASLQLSKIGKIADQCWKNIPDHFPFVSIDEYIVMPNHIHGIIVINKTILRQNEPNIFGPQSRNLGSIIRGYKIGVKKLIKGQKILFEWQSRYYDHIIRDEKSLLRIRKYIIDNPKNWDEDRNNMENLYM